MSVVCMHMHCSRSASCHPPLTPRSRGTRGSGWFHSSVHCRDGQPSRSRHSCRWTWVPGAWCTRWREGDGGPGPQRRTRRNFSWNSETAGRSRNLFCWAPVVLAVLKPAQRRGSTWVSSFPLSPTSSVAKARNPPSKARLWTSARHASIWLTLVRRLLTADGHSF